MNTKDILSPVRYLKGVGPKKAESLARLGVNTVEDVLFYLPRRYEDRSRFTPVRQLKAGEYQSVRGKVLASGMYATKKKIPVFQVALGDGTGIINCVWYNMPFLKGKFVNGETMVVYGKVEKYGKLQINHPDYEISRPDGEVSLNMGRIVPVYSLTEDVSQKYLRQVIAGAIQEYLSLMSETMPGDFRSGKKLVDLAFAVRNVHYPISFNALTEAYRRLVFEEFFMLQLALAKKKACSRKDTSGIKHDLGEEVLDELKKIIPFELTPGQQKAVADVKKDMSASRPMNRLVEGDVGSGKTLVALYALLLTVKNGYQGAIMAPTEILARQHFISMSEILMPLGINIRLLVSGIPAAEKSALIAEIKNGSVDIVCGTHSLFQEVVDYKKLGLIVVDEQHKFGVEQRDILRKKGINPHTLVMTATPIPRTLAMTVYGDLDVSIIREMPKGRRPITTFWLEEERRARMYGFVSDEIKKGRQAYIVYPRVAVSEDPEIRSVDQMFTILKNEAFKGFRLAYLHGKMDSVIKDRTMKDFKAGKYDILVSSVVIEVGIDVPNASVMVVENAERFGLAQLHQLRGRIGRGAFDSYCILTGKPSNETAARRIAKMVETQDGFEIAEEDLEIRGPGDILGTRQHGLPELRFGNILKDIEIMQEARAAAFEVVEKDPELSSPEHSLLKANFEKRFKG